MNTAALSIFICNNVKFVCQFITDFKDLIYFTYCVYFNFANLGSTNIDQLFFVRVFPILMPDCFNVVLSRFLRVLILESSALYLHVTFLINSSRAVQVIFILIL